MDDHSLEYGIIVGHLVGEYENAGKITFTTNFDYDVEFFDLANQLIKEFGLPGNRHYGYFSEFVKKRLEEIELEKKSNG